MTRAPFPDRTYQATRYGIRRRIRIEQLPKQLPRVEADEFKIRRVSKPRTNLTEYQLGMTPETIIERDRLVRPGVVVEEAWYRSSRARE